MPLVRQPWMVVQTPNQIHFYDQLGGLFQGLSQILLFLERREKQTLQNPLCNCQVETRCEKYKERPKAES